MRSKGEHSQEETIHGVPEPQAINPCEKNQQVRPPCSERGLQGLTHIRRQEPQSGSR